jgi:hypothetical protein
VPAALAIALAAGGLGAAYPSAFLAEPRAPGLLAGALLGLVGAGALAPLWALPLAAGTSAGADTAGPRVVLHARGISQLAIRRGELASTLAQVALLALGGALAGIVSAAAQGPASAGLHLAPSPRTLGLALAVGAASVILGAALGIATASVVRACTLFAAGVALTALLTGLAYFAPPLRFAAAASPFGSVLGALRDELLAPQFTVGTPYALRLLGLIVWVTVLGAAVARRTARQVR